MTKVLAQIVEDLKKYDPEKIILFGSHAWGTPNENSDLDFFIIKESDKPRNKLFRELYDCLTIYPCPMDFIIMTPKQIEQRKLIGDLFIKEVLEKGKTLYAKN